MLKGYKLKLEYFCENTKSYKEVEGLYEILLRLNAELEARLEIIGYEFDETKKFLAVTDNPAYVKFYLDRGKEKHLSFVISKAIASFKYIDTHEDTTYKKWHCVFCIEETT